jgi:hypothetical protein
MILACLSFLLSQGGLLAAPFFGHYKDNFYHRPPFSGTPPPKTAAINNPPNIEESDYKGLIAPNIFKWSAGRKLVHRWPVYLVETNI